MAKGKSERLKRAFKAYCAANGLMMNSKHVPNRALLLRRKGEYVLEVTRTLASNVATVVAFHYPAGVKSLTDEEMSTWLEFHTSIA